MTSELPSQEEIHSAQPCTELWCMEPAEFEISGGSGHFEDHTPSCVAHVGALLGTPECLKPPNTEWIVTPLWGVQRKATIEEMIKASDGRLVDSEAIDRNAIEVEIARRCYGNTLAGLTAQTRRGVRNAASNIAAAFGGRR